MGKNVLLIGRNPTVLAHLALALTEEGLFVQTTSAVEEASLNFDGADFDLVAFGRGVDEATNALLKAAFSDQNSNLLFVDGLAPVIPLLVKQIKVAFSDQQTQKLVTEFVCIQTDCSQVRITVKANCQLTICLYELDATHTTQQKTLVDESVSGGSHTFSLPIQSGSDATIKFLSAEADNRDLMVLPLR
ncbi:hypothetical protein [Spirosoma validum]|uniref:Uncharacterized protein n=1 Tax=Spirosoma validum TaxID=2771355 RepID=A0A927GGG3_9BACT|nr:hypothetical protein [Spirosoma validum]MBD2756967.1 hypothetical protein [Spirosoma validum]